MKQRCPECGREYEGGEKFCPKDGAKLTPVLGQDVSTTHEWVPRAVKYQDPLLGKLVGGRYRVEKFIGAGGMARVYLVRHEMLGKVMALKLLLPNLPPSTKAVERFRREARTVSRINHDNVVFLTDFGETDDGSLFMVMEYLEGETLADIIDDEAPLDLVRSLRICLQVARALEAAHSVKVVHRDLKPENIMILDAGASEEKVKILDFGIAKLMDPGPGGERLTTAGMVFGTPEYMSPEQAMGLELDGRADLYSLGLILWEMLTGRRCFQGRSATETLSLQVTAPPKAPSELLPPGRIPPAVDEMVLTLLAKKKEDRFANARHLQETLERIVDGLTKLPEAPVILPQPVQTAPTESAKRKVVGLARLSHPPRDGAGIPSAGGKDTKAMGSKGQDPERTLRARPDRGRSEPHPAPQRDGGAAREAVGPGGAARVGSGQGAADPSAVPTWGTTRHEPEAGRSPIPAEAPAREEPRHPGAPEAPPMPEDTLEELPWETLPQLPASVLDELGLDARELEIPGSDQAEPRGSTREEQRGPGPADATEPPPGRVEGDPTTPETPVVEVEFRRDEARKQTIQRLHHLVTALARRFWRDGPPEELATLLGEAKELHAKWVDLDWEVTGLLDDMETLGGMEAKLLQEDPVLVRLRARLADMEATIRTLEAEHDGLTKKLEALERHNPSAAGMTVGTSDPEVGKTCAAIARIGARLDGLRREVEVLRTALEDHPWTESTRLAEVRARRVKARSTLERGLARLLDCEASLCKTLRAAAAHLGPMRDTNHAMRPFLDEMDRLASDLPEQPGGNTAS